MRVQVDGRTIVFSNHARHRFAQRWDGELEDWLETARIRRKRPRWIPPEPPGIGVEMGLQDVPSTHYLIGDRGVFPLKRKDGHFLAPTFMVKGQTRNLGDRRRVARDIAAKRVRNVF